MKKIIFLLTVLMSHLGYSQPCPTTPTMHSKVDSLVARKIKLCGATPGLYKFNSNFHFVPAVAGTDYVGPSSVGSLIIEADNTRFVSGANDPYFKNKTSVGNVLRYKFSSGLSDWTQTGASSTFSQSGNYLQVTGGNNDFVNNYKYTDYQFCFNDAQIEIIDLIPTVDGTTTLNGIGCGIKSTDAQREVVCRLDLSNTATRGKLLIYTVISGTETLVTDSGLNLLSYTTNSDTLHLKVRRRRNGFVEAKAVNQTTGQSIEISSSISFDFRINHGAIYHFGGTQKMLGFNITNTGKGKSKGILIGDSITNGFATGFISDSQEDILCYGGSGQTSADVVLSIDNIINSGATYGILMIGMNDAGQSVSSSDYMVNIRKIVNALVEAGITPYICYVTPSTNGTRNTFIQAYNSALTSEYNGTWSVTDTYSPLSNDGTTTGTLNSIYDSGDGIHPNATGYIVINQTLYVSVNSKIIIQAPSKNLTNIFTRDYYGNLNFSSSSTIANRFLARTFTTSTGANAYNNLRSLQAGVHNLSTGRVTNAIPLYIESTVNSGGGTIDDNIGLLIAEQTVGANSNVGIQSLISSGTGKYNLNVTGTAQNYMAGLLTLGSNLAFTTGATTSIGTTDAQALNIQTSGSTRTTYNSNGSQSSTMAAQSSGTGAMISWTQPAHTGGSRPILSVLGGTLTGQTASTEVIDLLFNLSATKTWATSVPTTNRDVRIIARSYGGSGTMTTGTTFSISGPPSGVTITNPYALEVESGNSRFTGEVIADKYRLSALNTAPANASDTGTPYEIRIDADYIYICTATNTWKRVAISTWP